MKLHCDVIVVYVVAKAVANEEQMWMTEKMRAIRRRPKRSDKNPQIVFTIIICRKKS